MGSVHGFPGIDPQDAAVGVRLKRWREARGLSLDDLAEAAHTPAEDLRRAEAGRGHLDSAAIGAVTAALHLPLWALVSDTRAY